MSDKCFRIVSSETTPIDFHKGQSSEVNTFPNRQHYILTYLLKKEGGRTRNTTLIELNKEI